MWEKRQFPPLLAVPICKQFKGHEDCASGAVFIYQLRLSLALHHLMLSRELPATANSNSQPRYSLHITLLLTDITLDFAIGRVYEILQVHARDI
jgi:hypothetical protein